MLLLFIMGTAYGGCPWMPAAPSSSSSSSSGWSFVRDMAAICAHIQKIMNTCMSNSNTKKRNETKSKANALYSSRRDLIAQELSRSKR